MTTRIGLSLLLGIACHSAPSARVLAAEAERRPNLLFILTDDQGTLDAGCYGSTDLDTPAIDKLASRGTRFTQAYAHAVCCPARAMLLTGRHPQRSDVTSWMQGQMYGPKGRNMLTREITLAEILQAAGYRTALFGKWHLGAHPDHGPKKQGFDAFFGNRNGFIDNFNHYQLHRAGFHDLYEGTTEVFHRGHPKGHNYGANGGGGNTGPWIGAKGSFLEGGIRVPAILSFPGRLPAGSVRHQAVTAMDWLPTVLDLCGIPLPERVQLDGHSVLPLVKVASASSAYGVMHW